MMESNYTRRHPSLAKNDEEKLYTSALFLNYNKALPYEPQFFVHRAHAIEGAGHVDVWAGIKVYSSCRFCGASGLGMTICKQ